MSALPLIADKQQTFHEVRLGQKRTWILAEAKRPDGKQDDLEGGLHRGHGHGW